MFERVHLVPSSLQAMPSSLVYLMSLEAKKLVGIMYSVAIRSRVSRTERSQSVRKESTDSPSCCFTLQQALFRLANTPFGPEVRSLRSRHPALVDDIE